MFAIELIIFINSIAKKMAIFDEKIEIRESCFFEPRNNMQQPWTLYRLLGTLSKSLASQEIRTKDIRLAVNSTQRNPGIVVVSQV